MAALRLEVEVVDSHGAVLHQLEHEGQRYVVARPGPYTVRARHNNPSTMNLTMAVDGKSCGESWAVKRGVWATFIGFSSASLYVNNQQQVRYNEFVFVDTGHDIGMGAAGSQGAADVDLGVIEVKMWHVEQRPCIGRPACAGCAALEKPTQAGKVAPKLPAAGVTNKKFFQLPSLGSKAGAASTVGYAACTYHYLTVGAAVASVKLRCEMADTLRLRQVLDPRNPHHRALLPAAVVAAAAATAVPAGSRGTSTGARKQTELMERSAVKQQVVDLTQEQIIGVVAQRKRVKRETMELTTSGDAARVRPVLVDLTADD